MVQSKNKIKTAKAKSGPIHKKEAKESKSEQLIYKEELWQGPLPPPHYLEGYERIQKGLANRLVTDFEKQGNHRRIIEKTIVSSRIKQANRGQNWAGILSLVAIVGGIILILFDKKITGLAIIIVDITTLVGVFLYKDLKELYRRRLKHKEKNQSNKS